MIETLRMRSDSLREFASGASDAAGRQVLRDAQLSKHLLLLKQLVDRASEDLEKTALELMYKVDRTDRRALQTVLAYPHIGAWLTHCQREESWLDIAHLGAVAASAAIQAGLDFEVPVPARDGTVHLPMLGAARVGSGDRLVTAHGQAGRYWIDGGEVVVELPVDPHEDSAHWQGLRTLAEPAIMLDDIDPYRPPAKHRFMERLSAAEVERWRRSFDAACGLLARGETEWVAEILDLLSSVVPLQSSASGQAVSSTCRDALGSFSAALPATDEAFAATLVHEGQHNKLVALHLLMPLVDDLPDTRYYSPWRTDPRPAYGLLHGCYAFMGVADFWLTRCDGSKFPAFRYLCSARQVLDTLGPLAQSANLTDEGLEFVMAMRWKAENWNMTEFPRDIQSAVDDSLDDHRITWCLTNRIVRDQDVGRLTDAWLAGEPVDWLPKPELADESPEVFAASKRFQLTAAHLIEPGQNKVVHGNANAGDVALVQRDYAAAQRIFESQHDDRIVAWAGLALAGWRLSGLRIWYERPELIRAVHRRLGEILAEPPAPSIIAAWLRSGG